ncbi:hypothetical protein SAMN05216359_11961 [Roseateles sp. YR242]|uniref:catalase family protein n=1 Tax=Roseateles sp. YR242 TaxID=1855305 RepID=UPI0008C46626|nr:catalase family protein [Roseateles sp. YR242]SEL84823.1 hypothetical protein SAMN05216359_11961 [Roseateles sp. YR242]
MSSLPDIQPVVFSPEIEQTAPDEINTIAELVEVFLGMAHTVADYEGHAFRAVHAKGHALLRGKLTVREGLPAVYAQGLFAQPGEYEAIMRMSSPPAEQLSDQVSTPRAVALKLMRVPGERVPESRDHDTQDFLMVNGPVFTRPGPKEFLRDAKLLAATTEKAPEAKEVFSSVLRGAEKVIEALGGESETLKALGGEPATHPLGDTFYAQTPFLYGPYIAKFALAPVSPALTALTDQPLQSEDEDAQRHAISAFFHDRDGAPVEWELRVQLCTDLARMPVEDASVQWPEALSPFVAVASLVVPPQQSWLQGRSQVEEDELAFDPWHTVAAHRPLGAVNRARRVVLAASRQFRGAFNRCPIHEPKLRRA